MKNGSWPSGVTVALLSHSTWMRPAKVSATTGPADIRSITGCSPVGSPGKSPRFLTIPHDNSDLLTDRISPTQGFRLNALGQTEPNGRQCAEPQTEPTQGAHGPAGISMPRHPRQDQDGTIGLHRKRERVAPGGESRVAFEHQCER